MSPLTARIARDFTANGRKTALLAALTGVGLYFWLPPVWRAVRGASPTAAVVPPTTPTPTATEVAPATGATPAFSWRTAERTRRTDDLFASADRADPRADAFVLRTASLPIDAELVVDDPADPFPAPAVIDSDPVAPSDPTAGLVLRSTVVGRGRRIALINGTPYAEGAVVRNDGRAWTVRAVEAGRVVLADGDARVELRIDPFETAAVRAGPR